MKATRREKHERASRFGRNGGNRTVRYAVVGLGYISQAAVLPAFAHATENSQLTALVSDDPVKLRELAKKYHIDRTYSYEEYDDCLSSAAIDAVYIALPNNMHREYAVRAARAGVHVLCEKPMAITEKDCEQMFDAADHNGVRLMIAYRLHFDEANLKAVAIVQSGTLGEPRIFSSLFTMQVEDGNIRLNKELGGGTLYDIGIYCINAARYLFQDEPTEVFAFSANNGEKRFREVDEMTGALLRFPGERLVTFTSSFGAADLSFYRVIGTKGDLLVERAYSYSKERQHILTVDGKTKRVSFPKRDQFAPQLLYFSTCIMRDKHPEPSGAEGLIDVQIIRALYRSAEIGKPVKLHLPERKKRPTITQEIKRPAVKKPTLVRAKGPRPKSS